MATQKRYFLNFLALGALFLVLPATAASAFSDLYFFGDSLTDTGNNGPLDTDPALPGSFGYDPDRWTNAGGTLWSETFAAGLGFGAAAAALSDGGHNYAVGGARADELAGQISAFGADVGGVADPTALYVVWAGGNDLLQGQDPASTVNEVISAILSLQALGADRFLVANLPDFSPLAPGSGPLGPFVPIPPGADLWADDFNAGLSAALGGLASLTLFEYDAASVIDALVADPVGNGYAEGLDLCSEDPACISGSGTEDFLMHDHVHMMSGPHALVAAGALAAVPEPSTVLLAGLGLVVSAALHRRR